VKALKSWHRIPPVPPSTPRQKIPSRGLVVVVVVVVFFMSAFFLSLSSLSLSLSLSRVFLSLTRARGVYLYMEQKKLAPHLTFDTKRERESERESEHVKKSSSYSKDLKEYALRTNTLNFTL
jgi:hypothetical protein